MTAAGAQGWEGIAAFLEKRKSASRVDEYQNIAVGVGNHQAAKSGLIKSEKFLV